MRREATGLLFSCASCKRRPQPRRKRRQPQRVPLLLRLCELESVPRVCPSAQGIVCTKEALPNSNFPMMLAVESGCTTLMLVDKIESELSKGC